MPTNTPNKSNNLNWTPFALSRLNEIHDFILYREKSIELADKLINAIFERVEQLKNFPESGQKEPPLHEKGLDSRYLVEASYKIIYEYHPIHQTVIVTDIFHNSQYPLKIQRSAK